MALAHFRILINELFKKDPNTFPEVAPLIILNRKSDGCMSNDGKGKNYTRQISRRVHFVRNGDNFKMYKIERCEGGMQLSNIATKNFGETDLNPRMKYIMVRLNK